MSDYATRMVDDYCTRIRPFFSDGERAALILLVKEAMRDQRHACAEVIANCIAKAQTAPNVPMAYKMICDHAHQAVMNAEPKES
jgi:hypothetical protein